MSFPAELLLLAWLLLSIFSIGIALVHRFLPQRGFALIVYGAGAGVLVHGLFGLWIALLYRYHKQVTALLIGVMLFALVYLWRKNVVVDLVRELTRPIRLFLALWLGFVIFCIGITHLEIKWPSLEAGQFIFKTHTVNVKIQALADGPTDNSIAYIVQEYLLRHVSFAKEHPILIPYTYVTQRTILLPLVGLPFRAAIDPPPLNRGPLPKFRFDNRDVPDVEKLYYESGFRQFLVISILLNSLLLLGIGLFCSELGVIAALPLAAILFCTDPYFVTQAVFTWPKAFAGFFVTLAWDSFRRDYDARLVATCSAAAYHCHPYAIAFLAGMALCCFTGRDPNNRWRETFRFCVTAGLLLLPWVIWTRLVVGLPSGMLAYNLSPGGIHSVFPNPIWARLTNLFLTFVPTAPLYYPFQLYQVAPNILSSLTGAAGLVMSVPGAVRLSRLESRALLYAGICFPALSLILLFGHPNPPISHGLQPIAALLLFFGTMQLRQHLGPRPFWILFALQLLLNLIMLFTAGARLSAHFG